MTNMDPTDSICVVTGASSGIGAASARLLAQAGAKVALLDVNAADGQIVTQEIISKNNEAFYFQTDMLSWESVSNTTREIEEQIGPIHAWVNIAGGSGRRFGDGPLHECSEAGWDFTLDLNLKSTFLGSKAALQVMLHRNKGVIINVSSVLGMVGGDQDFATHAYAASKGGVISLTRAIAAYYAPHGIRANVICPGLIATPMSQRAQQSPKIRARLAELQPLTSDFGLPEDVAHAVVYLAFDSARFVTGAVLTVDGGWTVH